MLRRLYRVMLWTCPSDVRRELGSEMEEAFFVRLAVERVRRPWWWQPITWTRGFADAVLFALAMRRDARRRRVEFDPMSSPLSRARRPLMRRQDVRATLRLMRTTPLFTASIVLMLALGIGATTAIFSVVDGVLLKPLPFPHADRIVQIFGTAVSRQIDRHGMTEANFWDLREMNRSFAELGARHGASFTLTGSGAPMRVDGASVTVGFFRTLGVTPVQGRLFAPGEDNPGAPGTLAMLSHAFWTRQYASNPDVVGRTIQLDGRTYDVIGVLPPGSPWLDSAEVFVPLVRHPNANRGSWEYDVVARLKDDVSMATATADMDRVARALAAAWPKDNEGQGLTLAPSAEWIGSESLRRTLSLLLGAVSLLLVVACVNVANLLLARASGRVREAAMRTALGATRGDLIRERFTESIMLAGAGAIGGWLVALAALSVLRALAPGGVPHLDNVALDTRALVFTAGVAVVIGVMTGLVPALAAPVVDLVPALRQSQRGSMGDRQSDRLRGIFVAAEVALSLMLLVGAGLLVRSLVAVLDADRGFATDHRLVASFSVPGSYPKARREQITLDVIEHIKTLPGVVSVGYVSGRPLRGWGTGMGIVAADHRDIAERDIPWVSWRAVTEDYFKTMGLAIVRGRGFTDRDRVDSSTGAPTPVIVSQRLASRLWPDEDPVGRQAVLWAGQGGDPGVILGVVQDMREDRIEGEPTMAVYFPARGQLGGTSVDLVIHTSDRPERIVPSLRAALTSVDPGLPLYDVRTLEDLVNRSVAMRRFTMVLLSVFAGLALVLAVAGVYGVVAYSVVRRTGEIGVRLALGASPRGVLRRVVVRGMRPVCIGVCLGLIGMIGASRIMASLLLDVTIGDPISYFAATVGVMVAAALACYVPARQVLRIDPVVALRSE